MPEWSSHIYVDGVKTINPVFSEVNQFKMGPPSETNQYNNHEHIWVEDKSEETEEWEGITCSICGIGKRGPKGTLLVEQVQSSVSNTE